MQVKSGYNCPAIFIITLLAVLSTGNTGCAGRVYHHEVEETRKDGTKRREVIDYKNDSFDTKAGVLSVSKKPDGSLDARLENLDTTNEAIRLGGKIADIADKAIDTVKGLPAARAEKVK